MAETAVDRARAELARRRQIEAARAELARRQAAQPSAPAAPQRQLVATTEDGGQIYRMPSGSLAYTSQGYATSDQQKIAELMQGATPAEIVQSDFDRQRIDANPGRAVLNEVARGVPFVGSYTDEIIGLTNPEAGENLRALSGAMQREEPGKALAANLTGAVAGSLPLVAASAPAILANAPRTLGGRAAIGALAGGVAGGTEGAIYGAGLSGEEGPGETRGQNATTGGVVGTALGTTLGGLAPYASEGLKAVFGRLRGADVRTISNELGVSMSAARVIRNAISVGDDDAAMAVLQRGGDNAMLADVNQATRSLVDTAAQSPGDAGTIARRAVGERVREGTEQMNRALDDALGPPQGMLDMGDDIRSGTRTARSTAYDAAYAQPINYAEGNGRAIEQLLNRVPESAIRRANALMSIRGEQSAQIMARIGDDGRVTFEAMPDVRQLDYITRALRDVASESDGAGRLGGQTAMGSSLEQLASQIRQQMRAAVPEYGVALDTAADAIGQNRALENGYTFLRSGTTRNEAARMIADARGSEAEMRALRQGVRSYIDDVTANVSRTITDSDTEAREGIRILREMSSRSGRDKLRRLLGNEADALLDQIDEAATGFELRAAIAQNSKTAARQMTGESVREQTQGGIVRTLAQGEPVNATKRIVQAITGETAEAQQLREMGLYQEIAEALVNTRGGRARRALSVIENAMAGQAITDRQASFVAQTLIGGASGALLVPSREASTFLQSQ